MIIREVRKEDNPNLARMIRRVFKEFDAPTTGTVYSDPTPGLESMPHFSRALGKYKGLGFTYLDGPLGNSGHTGCDIWMLKEL